MTRLYLAWLCYVAPVVAALVILGAFVVGRAG